MALVIGVMTGTSLDAIDVSLVDVSGSQDVPTVSLIEFQSTPYSEECLSAIENAMAGSATMTQLADLPFVVAREYGSAINGLLTKHDGSSVLCIGAHGQTVWHNPPSSSWQVLNGSALAQLTNIPVVSDFRSADVALGGQGAPLVPMFDKMFFSDPDSSRVVLNIGGMANISVLPRLGEQQPVHAFDCGPGNILIDVASRLTFGKKYDDEGKIARAGMVIPALFDQLRKLEYFSMEPPKSTGRELFNEEFVRICVRKYAHPSAPSEDILATFTELTAWSVADHVMRYGNKPTELIVSGGGTRNVFLMERIAGLLPQLRILNSDELGVPSQAKESMCFAYLAYRTMHRLPSNIPSVTGATRPAILGSVSTP